MIDERTNVYTMGAIAFGLLGGETDHLAKKWEGDEQLYQIALQATEFDRSKRYSSVKEFYDQWMKFSI